MLIGYARVSTTGQNLESQIEHLQGEGCNTIFQEKLTGFDRHRPQLEKMHCELQPGDTLGNYMRKCASGGQSLANAERGVEMCGFVGKIDTEFFITKVHLYIIIGNLGPNILVAHFRM